MVYAFLHIPKTAGMALREALGAVGTISPQYPAVTDLSREPIAEFDMLAGHVSRRDWLDLFPGRKILTVLRDPIERCISSYWFHRHMDPAIESAEADLAKAHSPEVMFAMPDTPIVRAYDNRMTRQLGAHVTDYEADLDAALDAAKETLKRCEWVGIYETLDADVARLRQVPGFEALPPLNPVNVTTAKGPVSSAARSMIAERNRYDIELYEWARRRIGISKER